MSDPAQSNTLKHNDANLRKFLEEVTLICSKNDISSNRKTSYEAIEIERVECPDILLPLHTHEAQNERSILLGRVIN